MRHPSTSGALSIDDDSGSRISVSGSRSSPARAPSRSATSCSPQAVPTARCCRAGDGGRSHRPRGDPTRSSHRPTVLALRNSFWGEPAPGVVLTACIFLDNGLHSPLIFLLALPIANAALALRIRAVTICGIATLFELGAIAISNPSVGRSGDELTMLAASVVGLVVLALGWVTNRSQLEVAEAHLLAELTRLAQTDALTGSSTPAPSSSVSMARSIAHCGTTSR